jgi:phosphatidylglycerophosphatase A
LSDRAARFRRTLATAFGIGRLPLAPGTWASIASFVVAALLSDAAFPPVALAIAAVATVAGIAVGNHARADFGADDPSPFVLDEVAGYFAAVLRPSKPGLLELALALVLFRVFDVWKPFPIRQAERLRGGVGIVLDDLLAGGYTAALLMLIHVAFPALVSKS